MDLSLEGQGTRGGGMDMKLIYLNIPSCYQGTRSPDQLSLEGYLLLPFTFFYLH